MFGVPNSVLGFLMYAAIFLLVSFRPALPVMSADALVALLVLVGFLFSLYFMYVQGAVLRAFCTWCVISFINFMVMTWTLFIR
jgi:uncharacterized membrane protein